MKIKGQLQDTEGRIRIQQKPNSEVTKRVGNPEKLQGVWESIGFPLRHEMGFPDEFV